MTDKPLFWAMIFSGIMLLSVLYLFVFPPSGTSLFGWPAWLVGFIAIELIYSLSMWAFVQLFWKNKTQD